jgi:hypothetical protein
MMNQMNKFFTVLPKESLMRTNIAAKPNDSAQADESMRQFKDHMPIATPIQREYAHLKENVGCGLQNPPGAPNGHVEKP